MDEEIKGPAWPEDGASARALVKNLRVSDTDALFAFLLRAAAHRQWDFVALTLEEMSGYAAARGVRILGLRPKPLVEWMHLYRLTSLPPRLMPLLIDVIRFATPTFNLAGDPLEPERPPSAVLHAAFAVSHPGIEEDKERLRAKLRGR